MFESSVPHTMDIRLCYEEAGEGDILVLLHGNGEDHGCFSAQIKAFSPYYRVIAVDTRGHGLSPRGTKPFTLSQFADDLYDFLIERGISRLSLLGFSDGGNIALLFALRHAEMLDKLVLNGANLFPEGLTASALRFIEQTYRESADSPDPEKQREHELFSLMVNEPHIDPSELAAIPCRTLVLAGERDLIREEHTRLIHASLPDAELVILPGDHFLVTKRPDAYNETVLRFLLA